MAAIKPEVLSAAGACKRLCLSSFADYTSYLLTSSLKALAAWKGGLVEVMMAKVVMYMRKRGLMEEKEMKGITWLKAMKAANACPRYNEDGSRYWGY